MLRGRCRYKLSEIERGLNEKIIVVIHIRWMSSVETSYSMGTMNKDDILRLTDRGMAIFKHYLLPHFV